MNTSNYYLINESNKENNLNFYSNSNYHTTKSK